MKILSFCRACGTPLPNESECCLYHTKQLIRSKKRYWITQGYRLYQDIQPDGRLKEASRRAEKRGNNGTD